MKPDRHPPAPPADDGDRKRKGRIPRFTDRRDAIIAGASRILVEKGIKGMTLANAAQSVGLITTSVTYYFKRKDDLVAACILRGVQRIEALIEAAVREPAPEDRLRTLVRSYFELQRRIQLGDASPLVQFMDARGLERPHAESIAAAYLSVFKRARAVFDADTLAGLKRKDRDARATLLLFLVTWAPAWIHRFDPDEYPRIADRMLDILLNGFATAPSTQWGPPPAIATGDEETPNDAYETFLIAATGLLNEGGYHGASVDKIASRVSVTKGSFYHHLDSKDDLVAACYDRTFEIIRRAQHAASALPGSWWNRLSAACATLIAFQMSDRGPLVRTISTSALPPQMGQDMVLKSNRVSHRFASMIADGIIDGSVRPIDAAVASQMVTVTVTSVADLRFWFPDVTSRQAIDLYLKPLLLGIFVP
jgi:AcrR family transcriptional regulator